MFISCSYILTLLRRSRSWRLQSKTCWLTLNSDLSSCKIRYRVPQARFTKNSMMSGDGSDKVFNTCSGV